MRDPQNIRAVEALGIDIMGFIFWPQSSRYAGEKPGYLPEKCLRAGVFVDAAQQDILKAVAAFRLDIIQLHGHETPGDVAALRKSVAGVNPAITITKSLAVAQVQDLEQAADYESVCDAFLFDTKGELPGGNGSQFDWSLLENYKGRLRFLLSGGIGPGDADRVRAFRHPACAGIDLNSRFETAPGLKDVDSLKTFIEKLRQ